MSNNITGNKSNYDIGEWVNVPKSIESPFELWFYGPIVTMQKNLVKYKNNIYVACRIWNPNDNRQYLVFILNRIKGGA